MTHSKPVSRRRAGVWSAALVGLLACTSTDTEVPCTDRTIIGKWWSEDAFPAGSADARAGDGRILVVCPPEGTRDPPWTAEWTEGRGPPDPVYHQPTTYAPTQQAVVTCHDDPEAETEELRVAYHLDFENFATFRCSMADIREEEWPLACLGPKDTWLYFTLIDWCYP